MKHMRYVMEIMIHMVKKLFQAVIISIQIIQNTGGHPGV